MPLQYVIPTLLSIPSRYTPVSHTGSEEFTELANTYKERMLLSDGEGSMYAHMLDLTPPPLVYLLLSSLLPLQYCTHPESPTWSPPIYNM